MKNLLYEIKEFWPKWARILLCLACVALLLAAIGIVGWHIYDSYMGIYKPFSRTYEGIRWTYWDLEPSEPITVTLEGKKNGYGMYAGTVVIRGAEFEYTFTDCRIRTESDGKAYLCSSEVDGRDDPAACTECAYAWMMMDRMWETIAFYKLSPEKTWSDCEDKFISDFVYTAPAKNLEEAVAHTKALSQNVDAFRYLTWDKRDAAD